MPPKSPDLIENDAWEAISAPPGAAVALCCEHASARIPPPWTTTAADAPWLQTHWSLDLGARALTIDLAARMGAPAVLARFNRLLCDANRPEHAADLCRAEVEGHVLSFNRGVDAAERERRLARFHRPYHGRIDRMLADGQPGLLFSVHTYTPRYLDQVRQVQLGVLFDLHDELGAHFAELLRPTGLQVEENAPWSGKKGLAYSPDRHGRAAGIPYLELEVRNDLLASAAAVSRIGATVAQALHSLVDAHHLHARRGR